MREAVHRTGAACLRVWKFPTIALRPRSIRPGQRFPVITRLTIEGRWSGCRLDMRISWLLAVQECAALQEPGTDGAARVAKSHLLEAGRCADAHPG